MRKSQIEKFKIAFEEQRDLIISNQRKLQKEIARKLDDSVDEGDHTTSDLEKSLQIRLQGREMNYLKKLNLALDKIQSGTFGECEECGADIEVRRLEARPTATHCIACKEEQEHKELMLKKPQISSGLEGLYS